MRSVKRGVRAVVENSDSRSPSEPERCELEPERYELRAGPSYRFELDRRSFVKVLGGGILVTLALRDLRALQESGGGPGRSNNSMPAELGAWLHIGQDGIVTVYTGKTEIGQNIRTSLAQVVAEELG
ncbi:MAG: molybdopterin-dependent oxidoreductase, partial [Acidobacteria bacterium]|nr:molybdopterin-dependent oxidoreductase [Acidobacteriota bacterium]